MRIHDETIADKRKIENDNKRPKRSMRQFYMDNVAELDNHAKEFYENLTKDEAFLNRMRKEYQEELKTLNTSNKEDLVGGMLLKGKMDDMLHMDKIIDEHENKEEREILKSPVNNFRPGTYGNKEEEVEALRQMLEGGRKRRYVMGSEERNRLDAWNLYCNITGDKTLMDNLREEWKKANSSSSFKHFVVKRDIAGASNAVKVAFGNEHDQGHSLVNKRIFETFMSFPIVGHLKRERERRFLCRESAERDKLNMWNAFSNLTAGKGVVDGIRKEWGKLIKFSDEKDHSFEADEHSLIKRDLANTEGKVNNGNNFAAGNENQGNTLIQKHLVQTFFRLPVLRRIRRYYGQYAGHEKGPEYYKVRAWFLKKFLNETGRPQNYSFGSAFSDENLETGPTTLKIVTKKVKNKKKPNITDPLETYKKRMFAPLLNASFVQSSVNFTNSSSPARRRRNAPSDQPAIDTDRPPKTTRKRLSTTLNLTVEAAIKRAKKEARKFGLMLEKCEDAEKRDQLEDEHFHEYAHEPYYIQKTSPQPITVFSWEATETGETGELI